jgi:glycerol-3-phosphate dehydrogenase (NAD(P)+)
MKLAILGAGAWGTALAIVLSGRHAVSLWTRAEADRLSLRSRRESRYLAGATLPPAVQLPERIEEALAGDALVLLATSTAGLRPMLERVAPHRPAPALLWACKGFEQPSGLLPHEIVAAALPGASRVGVLSGPSFALEVARGQPTALVIASADAGFASEAMAALNEPRLRVYSSGDVVGVELGGAIKNVIAIAAGISDGLALGRNARAALVTRGLAEIVRLGQAMGGRSETFMGLAGLGDLVLTCTGDLSRNREVGVRLAGGAPLEAILRELGHVSEGAASALAVQAHASRLHIEMPIVEAVCAVLQGGASPGDAVARLLSRDPRAENL